MARDLVVPAIEYPDVTPGTSAPSCVDDVTTEKQKVECNTSTAQLSTLCTVTVAQGCGPMQPRPSAGGPGRKRSLFGRRGTALDIACAYDERERLELQLYEAESIHATAMHRLISALQRRDASSARGARYEVRLARERTARARAAVRAAHRELRRLLGQKP